MPEKLFFPFWLLITFAIIANTQFDIDKHHFLINSNSPTDDGKSLDYRELSMGASDYITLWNEFV